MSSQPAPPAVFTAAQAESGRLAYEKTCGKCHTPTLTGRNGDAGELPPLDSLSPDYQAFIQKFGPVPALAGKAFIGRWKDRTLAQVVARFQEGVNAFPPDGMTGETAVEITAYALKVSGAKPGDAPLTRSTSATVASIIR